MLDPRNLRSRETHVRSAVREYDLLFSRAEIDDLIRQYAEGKTLFGVRHGPDFSARISASIGTDKELDVILSRAREESESLKQRFRETVELQDEQRRAAEEEVSRAAQARQVPRIEEAPKATRDVPDTPTAPREAVDSAARPADPPLLSDVENRARQRAREATRRARKAGEAAAGQVRRELTAAREAVRSKGLGGVLSEYRGKAALDLKGLWGRAGATPLGRLKYLSIAAGGS